MKPFRFLFLISLVFSRVSFAAEPTTLPSVLLLSTGVLQPQGRVDPPTPFFFHIDSGWLNPRSNSRGDIFLRRGLLCDYGFPDRPGSIMDLGEKNWDAVRSLPQQKRQKDHSAQAVAGHMYLVHIVNDRDFWALVRVTVIDAAGVCTIEWARPGQVPPTPPAVSAQTQTTLAVLLDTQKDNLDASMILSEPAVTLQLRSGAVGGNPLRIDMLGGHTVYFDKIADEPIPLDPIANQHTPAVAFYKGGRIPPGKVWTITRVTFHGSATGDSNGHGAFIVHAGHTDICGERDSDRVEGGDWQGHIEIRPGEESSVYLEGANSTVGETIFSGTLTDDVAPVHQPDSGKETLLGNQEPWALLQLSVAAGPDELALSGKIRNSATHSEALLPMEQTLNADQNSAYYAKRFRIPRGKMYVVHSIHCSATVDGDRSGAGRIWLKLGTQNLLDKTGGGTIEPFEWHGDYTLHRGEESRLTVYLQNSSMADVRVDGEFIDDPDPQPLPQ